MNHICIIGCGGVGKAHALSAAKYLIGKPNAKITLVDYEDVLQKHYSTRTWKNSWGPISDEIVLPLDFHYEFANIGHAWNLVDFNADLYIIATPNEYHEHYLKLLQDKVVLCEKPIVAFDQPFPEISDKVHLGIEWLYHPIIKEMQGMKLSSIDFVHAWPPEPAMWDWNFDVYDLGSHVLSIYQHLNTPKELDLIYSYREGRVTHTETLDHVKLSFGYDKTHREDVVVINRNIRLAWIPFNDGDLFYRQIEYIMNGNAPLLSTDQIKNCSNLLEALYKDNTE